MEDVKKPFGVAVKAWRNRMGISQEELAGRAGLHRTYVCDIERGARNVSLESIDKLARALQITVSALFSYADHSSRARPTDLVDIVFVEDNPEDVELTLTALKAANFTNQIHVARDGAAALDYLFCEGEFAQRVPAERPQIVLLDLGLPKGGRPGSSPPAQGQSPHRLDSRCCPDLLPGSATSSQQTPRRRLPLSSPWISAT